MFRPFLVSAFMLLTIQVTDAQTQVKLEPAAPVNPGVFGANNMQAHGGNIIADPAYKALIKNLGIRHMRYLSGSPTSFWDWKRGKMVPQEEITRIWADNGSNWILQLQEGLNALPDGTLGPLAFVPFARETGTRTQWLVNLTTRPDQQPEMFDMLASHRAEVEFVEMDNEAYFWSNEFGRDAQSGYRYAQRVAQLAPHIRRLYPDARIGMIVREDDFFVGEHIETHGEKRDLRFAHWNEHVTAAEFTEHFDALILHHYIMSKGRLDPFTTDDARGSAFLAFPQLTLERAAELIKERYGPLPMWITEYNVIAYHAPRAGTSPSDQWMNQTKHTPWAAFYQAGFWLTAMNNPDAIEILNHHSVLNVDIGWGLGKHTSQEQAQFTAVGQLFAHLSHLALQYRTMAPLVFADGAALDVDIDGQTQIPALQGTGFVSAKGKAAVVINRSPQPQTIVLPFAVAAEQTSVYLAREKSPHMATVKFNGDLAVWEQGPMQAERAIVKGAREIALPGFSVLVATQ